MLEVAEVPPVGGEALQGRGGSGEGQALPTTRARTLGTPAQPLLARHMPRPHLQLPHHKLLGHVVPPGPPENRRVAQVVLQIPALGLGRRAGSGDLAPNSGRGGGCWLPGGWGGPSPGVPVSPQLTGHTRSYQSLLGPGLPASSFYRTLSSGRSGACTSCSWGSALWLPALCSLRVTEGASSAHFKCSLRPGRWLRG